MRSGSAVARWRRLWGSPDVDSAAPERLDNLQQKKDSEADQILKTFDQYDADSPAFYYGNAVKLFIKENKEGANEWLESAKRIYPKEVNEVYNDSLVEMGWLETLQ